MQSKLKYIDLFAGCGGLSLGLHNSGRWEGVFAVEKSKDAFRTLQHNLIDKKNHFSWPEWLEQTNHDINSVLKCHKKELAKLKGEIDLIVGGPPCQGFSSAGRREENDKRNSLIKSYIKFIRLVQPKVIFFENVKGFTQAFDKNKVKGRKYSEFVKNSLRRDSPKGDYTGYDVYGELVDFSMFGIPQKRTRFILVGIRKDLTNEKSPNDFFALIRKNRYTFFKNKGLNENTTLKEAISDLLRDKEKTSTEFKTFKMGLYGKCNSNYQRLLKGDVKTEIPDSHRFVNHSEKTVKKFVYILDSAERNKNVSKSIKEKFNIKKHTIIPLSGDQPAPTITTLPDDYIHYNDPRVFTVREYARIQSFNDWFEFKGKYTTGGQNRVVEVPRYSQIGNAIPPLFGEQSGIAISKILSNE